MISASYIHNSLSKLKEYCEQQDYKGWDPYDGLSSGIFKSLPLTNSRIFRLLWIQLFKGLPINLRGLFLIPREYNPKGLALFLSGYVNICKAFGNTQDKEKIDYLTAKLMNMRSKQYSNSCWGYNFDWQSRAFFLPKFTPNVIVSTFVGNAILDVYELTDDGEYIEIAESICKFILDNLNRSFDDKGNFCFSYSPLDNSKIFNASLLAAKFLSRVYYFNKDKDLIDEAKKTVDFCCNRQNNDGSWFYGLGGNQRWIDSFHTGYNLESLYEYQKYTGDDSYVNNFQKGFRFYLSNFFTKEGTPKYYNNSIYPIDSHNVAQLIVLLSKLGLVKGNPPLIEKILRWTINNMQDKKGYFYYRQKKFYKIKIPYIRWSSAWMFYALSFFN